jgi:hypothetical protein
MISLPWLVCNGFFGFALELGQTDARLLRLDFRLIAQLHPHGACLLPMRFDVSALQGTMQPK